MDAFEFFLKERGITMQQTVLPDEKDFSSSAYKKSRSAYLWECAFEYFVTLLVTETFLANLLSYMGFAEQEIGVISSLVSLAFIFQLLSLLLVQTPFRRKSLVLVFDACGQLFFLCLYILPFLPVDAIVRKVLVFVFILLAYLCQYVVANIKYQWGNSYVHPTKRASYSATKEIVSLITGILFSLAMGAIYDAFVAAENLVGGFLFIAAVMLVVDICNFICLILIKKDEPKAETSNQKSFKDIFDNTLKNKSFCKVVLVAVLWKCAYYFSLGFMGTFKIDLIGSVDSIREAGQIMLVVQIINMLGSFARIVASKPFGRYSDRTSFTSGFYLALFFAAAAFVCIMLSFRELWFFIILYTILTAVAQAGINQNSFNMIYSYVNSDYIAEAMAVQSSISGVCGFLCSLIAGQILAAVNGAGWTLFGTTVFGQQVLGMISLLLCVACILFVQIFLKKDKVMKQ